MKKLTAWILVLALCPLPVFAQDPTPPPEKTDFEKWAHEEAEKARRDWELMFYGPPQTHTHRSSKLAWTGGWLLGGGSALLLMSLPWSFGETYELNHDPYCVDLGPRRLNIDEGACYGEATPELRPYGYAMVGAGAVMLLIGLQKVPISPQLAPGVVGAKATLRW